MPRTTACSNLPHHQAIGPYIIFLIIDGLYASQVLNPLRRIPRRFPHTHVGRGSVRTGACSVSTPGETGLTLSKSSTLGYFRAPAAAGLGLLRTASRFKSSGGAKSVRAHPPPRNECRSGGGKAVEPDQDGQVHGVSVFARDPARSVSANCTRLSD